MEFGDLLLVGGDFYRFAHHATQELYLISIEFYKVAFHDLTVPHKLRQDVLTSIRNITACKHAGRVLFKSADRNGIAASAWA